MNHPPEKPLVWVGRAKKDFKQFPEPVQDVFGYALYLAQIGLKHPHAKPLKGFQPAVMEITDDYLGNAYRAIYTVKLGEIVYVLHAFQKKSPRGIKTCQEDLALIWQRLQQAKEIHLTQFSSPSRTQ